VTLRRFFTKSQLSSTYGPLSQGLTPRVSRIFFLLFHLENLVIRTVYPGGWPVLFEIFSHLQGPVLMHACHDHQYPLEILLLGIFPSYQF
jgi:hypothetical protein